MSDKYAADERLLLNAQEVENQLRHLADNDIDSDSFAVFTENYNGRETEFERTITDLAIDAANLVGALVSALEAKEKCILDLLAERDADKRRIAELDKESQRLSDQLGACERERRAFREQAKSAEVQIKNLEHFIAFWRKVQSGTIKPSKNEIDHTVWFLEGIAELESRTFTVKLPQRYSMLHRSDFDEPYHTEMVYKQHELLEALAAAGISLKIEGE